MLLGRNRAIGAIEIYSGADLATLKILHFDVSFNTLAKCGMVMPREVAIPSPRSSCRGSQTIVKRRQTVADTGGEGFRWRMRSYEQYREREAYGILQKHY
jgi:hypothetical protein